MASTPKTILAIGAHYDDCVFGIPGLLLQAVQKNHHVVILSLIGDYTNWPPAKDRSSELKEVSASLAHYLGVEMRFLNYASGRFSLNEESKAAVARIVAEVKPDSAFVLWHQDRHPDHEAASAISKAALKLAGRILDDTAVKAPTQIYYYDNGPGHTIGFEPNTFVDVSEVWPTAIEWLAQLMAFVRGKPYDELAPPDPAVAAKTTLARYRGASCGAKYAEAVWALQTISTKLF
jgi:LmbE family N-acetylglucosaminyl deacetylase